MLGDRIRRARKEKGLTLEQTAALVGVCKSTIFKIERGEVKTLKNTTAERMSEALDIPLDELIEGADDDFACARETVKCIPVFEHVGCGVPAFGSDDAVDYIPLPPSMNAEDFFGLFAKGDSMEPLISNGDLLILEKQNAVESGEYAAVRIGDEEFLLKKVKMSMTGLTLVSLNEAYEPIFYSWEDVASLPVTIIGKLTKVVKNV